MKNRKTQLQKLLSLFNGELFHTNKKEGFIRITSNGCQQVWKINSDMFRYYLINEYMKTNPGDHPPIKSIIEEAINILEAKALIEGPENQVYLRVAKSDEGIYLDLCNKDWEVIRITKDSWEVLQKSPIDFYRSNSMLPIPRPHKDSDYSDLNLLKKYLNFKDENDFKLLVAWLLTSVRDDIPLPILTLQGEQGSAKSTTSKVLKLLIDPSEMPIRSLPKKEDDLALASIHSWILSFDNISGLSDQLSDSLCKISTGGSFSKRALYTNDDEYIFSFRRPLILNGIDELAKRQDLLDRSIVLYLPTINENERMDEESFWKSLELDRPKILGAILNLISLALKRQSYTKLEYLPRMADFCKWIVPIEEEIGWQKGGFLKAYEINKNNAVIEGIESNVFGSAILQLMENIPEWEGNVTALLKDSRKYIDLNTIKYSEWPSIRTVRRELRRLSPGLRRLGIEYTECQNKKHKTLKLVNKSKLS